VYLLVAISIAVALAIVLALCLTFVGGQPRASYSELKAAIHTVTDKYGGTVHDRGSMDGLGVEFEIDGIRMFAGTFVSHRRKYINYYAFEIRSCPSDGSKSHRQVLSLAEAQSVDRILSTISVVAADSQQQGPNSEHLDAVDSEEKPEDEETHFV
jgi:hypothetical protein